MTDDLLNRMEWHTNPKWSHLRRIRTDMHNYSGVLFDFSTSFSSISVDRVVLPQKELSFPKNVRGGELNDDAEVLPRVCHNEWINHTASWIPCQFGATVLFEPLLYKLNEHRDDALIKRIALVIRVQSQ